MSSKKVPNLIINDEETVNHARTWIAAKEKFEAAESTFEMEKTVFTGLARRGWFRTAAGRHTVSGSVEIPTPEGRTALVSFASIWSCKGGLNMLPADLTRTLTEVKINPEVLGPNAEAFVKGVQALAASLGIPDAVTVKANVIPVPTFNDVRNARFTPEENEALEAAGLGTRITARIKAGKE